MPDRVPCEKCPWVARQKRRPGTGETPEEKARVASGGWRACDEDGGTCWGAVRFTQSDEAAAYLEEPAPAAARQQSPETPMSSTTTVKRGTAVDFVTTGKETEK